jgi:hypothetical protein
MLTTLIIVPSVSIPDFGTVGPLRRLSLFLLAPDARRLVNVLLLNRPADRSTVPPLMRFSCGWTCSRARSSCS